MAEFSDYAWLVDDEAAAAWLARLTGDDRPALQQLGSLRRELPAERARLLVEQTELRQRAAAKFGADAASMFFTPTLLEQATDRWIGNYKAARVHAAAPGRMVHDYCCGIGGDLIELARQGPCIGYDLSEVACLLATANVRSICGEQVAQRAAVEQTDAEQSTPRPEEAWHIDPDRRAAGKRTTKVELHSPGPELIDRWLRVSPHGAVKLAPATEPPAAWRQTAELEWITTHRECRQLIAWFGQLTDAPGQRRATIVNSEEETATFIGIADVPFTTSHDVLAYVFDPDPSVLAAGLLGAIAHHHELKSLGVGGAYLTGEQGVDDPLLQSFQVQDCLPLRAPAVAPWLAARNVGRVEIKKRGVAVDPDKFRRELKLHGDNEATVILTRIGKRQVAIIAERLRSELE